MNGASRGVVLASYGRGVLIQLDGAGGEDGLVRCSLKTRRQKIVCGDRVTASSAAGRDGTAVDSIEPRRNLIERIDSRGRPEPVAANVDRLAVVVAPEPAPDWFLVDRYWAGAQLIEIPALLIVNKADLGRDAIRSELDTFAGLGLPYIETTAPTGNGIGALREALEGCVTLLVGQSGVGKSSLVNALAPRAAAQTAELTRDAEGRHTTTTARRYWLGPRSAVVDAPGVRDFAAPARLARAAEHGFVEILARRGECRFNDCRHMEEPGCGVRAAVVEGTIARRRYESYRRLFRLYERLAPP